MGPLTTPASLAPIRSELRPDPVAAFAAISGISLVAMFVAGSEWAAALCFGVLGWSHAAREQRACFFTRTHLQGLTGLLRLRRVQVSLSAIDDVVVEPKPAPPGAGTINVRYGLQHLIFPWVPEAEEKADLLRIAVGEAMAKDRVK